MIRLSLALVCFVVAGLLGLVALYYYVKDQRVGRDPVSPRDWRRIEQPAARRGFAQKKGRQ